MIVPTSTSYKGNTKQFAHIELAPLGKGGRRLLDFFTVVLQFDRLENSVIPKKLSTGNWQYAEIQTLTFHSGYTTLEEWSETITVSSEF